jgi:hypothetical protein
MTVIANRRTAWVCTNCKAPFVLKLSFCPRCRNLDFTLEKFMPKITTHNGPSDAIVNPPTEDDPYTEIARPVGEPGSQSVRRGTQRGRLAAETAKDEEEPVKDEPENRKPAEVDGVENDGPGLAPILTRPSTAASKAEWVEYAQAITPDEDLSNFTKADLIELYGAKD